MKILGFVLLGLLSLASAATEYQCFKGDEIIEVNVQQGHVQVLFKKLKLSTPSTEGSYDVFGSFAGVKAEGGGQLLFLTKFDLVGFLHGEEIEKVEGELEMSNRPIFFSCTRVSCDNGMDVSKVAKIIIGDKVKSYVCH
jgi:hypothetical protein